TAQGVDPGRRPPKVSGQVKQSSVEPKDGTELRVAELLGTPRDRLEHGLDIGRRTGDHAKDLARRGLLLQRFRDLRMGLRERCVLFLQLCKETNVLDGDDRLVSEGLE